MDSCLAKVEALPGVEFHGQGILSEKELMLSSGTTLPHSMEENGIDWIDVLKMDGDGAEWGIFVDLVESGAPMPYSQILLELHTPYTDGVSEDKMDVIRRFFKGMAKASYRVFSAEPNLVANAREFYEYSFIKVDKQGYFITK